MKTVWSMADGSLDRPKMGSKNQKSGFAQRLKISIFSVPKLHKNVQGSIQTQLCSQNLTLSLVPCDI